MLHDAGGRRLYVGHMFSDGITVLDVARPARARRPVALPAPARRTRAPTTSRSRTACCWRPTPPISGRCSATSRKPDYFTAPLADSFTRREREFTAGLRVFDLADPAAPREIGFCPVEGIGLHRIWWTGGRYAYASCHLDGYTDHILATFDLADPARPTLVDAWALPGMNRGAGEAASWPEGKRWALHHMIVAGDRGYAAWRDGGVTVHDLSDPARPALLSHRAALAAVRRRQPYAAAAAGPRPGGAGRRGDQRQLRERAWRMPGCSTCASRPTRCRSRRCRSPARPITAPSAASSARTTCMRTGPARSRARRCVRHLAQCRGPRLRPLRPVPPARRRPSRPRRRRSALVDIRPGAVPVTQSCDVLVDRDGLVFVTDTNAGLSVLQFDGI